MSRAKSGFTKDRLTAEERLSSAIFTHLSTIFSYEERKIITLTSAIYNIDKLQEFSAYILSGALVVYDRMLESNSSISSIIQDVAIAMNNHWPEKKIARRVKAEISKYADVENREDVRIGILIANVYAAYTTIKREAELGNINIRVNNNIMNTSELDDEDDVVTYTF
jgi:hypothetical protein